MRRALTVFAIMFLPCLIIAQETGSVVEKHSVTIDDLLSFKSIGNPRISPDGEYVLYVFTKPDLKKNERKRWPKSSPK